MTRFISKEEQAKSIYDAYSSRTKITADGDLLMGDLPTLWVRREMIFNTWKELQNAVGKHARVLMYNMGKPHGKASFENIKGFLNITTIDDNSIDKLLEFLCSENMVVGWGTITIKFEPSGILVTNEKGFPVGRETVIKNLVAETTYPVDAYFLGYFEGFLGAVYNTKFTGEEIECVGNGGNACKFMFREVELPEKLRAAGGKVTKIYDAKKVLELADRMRKKLEIALPERLIEYGGRSDLAEREEAIEQKIEDQKLAAIAKKMRQKMEHIDE